METLPNWQFIVLHDSRVHRVPDRHRDDGVHAKAFHEEAMSDVDRGWGKVPFIGVAVGKQGIGFALDSAVQLRLLHHRVDR